MHNLHMQDDRCIFIDPRLPPYHGGIMTTPEHSPNENAKVRATRVEIRVKGTAHGERPVYGVLTNLSRTGAFLQSAKSLEMGTELELTFTLAQAKGETSTIQVRGEVKHRGRGREHGVGIRYIRLSRDAVLAIDQYLAVYDSDEA